MVTFVVDNGYVERAGVVLKQVAGFGMGVACAGQLANLGLYPVERDFAKGCSPNEVLHNYRFIDDIETLTGCIPTEKQYGMKYKDTKPKEGELVFLGMVQKWVPAGKGAKFITGMHFQDAAYSIRIRHYPAGGGVNGH